MKFKLEFLNNFVYYLNVIKKFEMNIYTILFLVAFIILCVVMTNLTLRLNNKQRNKLNEIKLNLEKNYGIKQNF